MVAAIYDVRVVVLLRPVPINGEVGQFFELVQVRRVIVQHIHEIEVDVVGVFPYLQNQEDALKIHADYLVHMVQYVDLLYFVDEVDVYDLELVRGWVLDEEIEGVL